MTRTAAVTIALLLAGCTTAKTMMLSENTALISGRDSGWGDAGSVQRRILTTAAELGQARGYEYFEIVSSTDTTKRGVVPVAGQSSTYGSAVCTPYYCSGQSRTTGTPGYLAPYTQAGADVMVRFYRANEAPSTAYSVAAILSQK